MLTVKLPDDYLSKIGASSVSEFQSKLDAVLKERADILVFKAESETKIQEANFMKEQFQALEKRIEALEQKSSSGSDIKTLIEAAKTEAVSAAKAEASRIVGEAFAATGTVPVKGQPNDGTTAPKAIDETDFKSRWDAMNSEQRAEYGGRANVFEAYEKARLKGAFKLFQKK
jgi:hypothetical protein